jgi:hypothetical protein
VRRPCTTCVARFMSSETTDKSGDGDPFISDVPVAAVMTLSSIASTSIPSALSIAPSSPVWPFPGPESRASGETAAPGGRNVD